MSRGKVQPDVERARKRDLVWILSALLPLAACHRLQAPASVVNVADGATANQLLSGFYGVEGRAWRWTAQEFTVALGPPRGAAKNGAKLLLRIYVPGVQIEELGPMTLSAEVGGVELQPETFSKSGIYTYTRDVPASVLDTNVLPASFSLDQSSGSTDEGGRVLGVVVSSIELQANY